MIALIFITIISASCIYGENFMPDSKIYCANGGVGFSNGQGNAFCRCGPRTTGKQCQIIIPTPTSGTTTMCNPCANNQCGMHGQCFNNNCQPVCQCYAGYYGLYCQYTLITSTYHTTTTTPCTTTSTTTTTCNPCIVNPCQNSGMCSNSNCYATCTCQNGFYGDLCQYSSTVPVITTTPIAIQCSPCSINLCQNGGKCIDNNNCLGTCQCGFSYYGEFCQYPIIIAPTEPTPCVPLTTFAPVTSCNPCGYNNGNGPCQNGGLCINSNCQAMCQCRSSSYYGNYCQYQVATTTPCVTTTYVPVTSCNPCGYNNGNGPCQNGGMCINSNCQAMCQCSSSSYYGNYCQYQVAVQITTTPCPPTFNVCAINPCQNGGQCYSSNGQAYCNCNSGFSGQYCQICLKSEKQNGTKSLSP